MGYYDSLRLKLMWPLIKLGMLSVLFSICCHVYNWFVGCVSIVFVLFSYQHIVAMLVPNTIVIPSMD